MDNYLSKKEDTIVDLLTDEKKHFMKNVIVILVIILILQIIFSVLKINFVLNR